MIIQWHLPAYTFYTEAEFDRFSPIGVMSLIAAEIVNIDNLASEFRRLGMYALTVVCGLFIHGFVVLPVLLLILGRRNPLKFLGGMSQALFVGFGTCSSNATMPVTLQCIEDNIKIDRRIARFLIPLGIAINMNGTALYEAVAAIYVGQCLGAKFQFGDLMMVSISALFAGMGTAAVPQGGLVTLVMVLMAVGLPPKYIILIVPIDWLLGRCRVIVNVFDDSVACAIVHRLNEKHLRKITTQSDDGKIEHL
uniref:Amino acid transporter n=1 Tax=Romanomermis culicivorax TaxID=13658 RepID=A0A915KFP3_ROMCU